ncbi:hypothetical protein ACQ5SK_45410 [Bradyrhizobium japonicum]
MLRPAKIAADIGRPHHEQHEHQRGEAVDEILPHQDRGRQRRRCVGEAGGRPDELAPRDQRHDRAADEAGDDCGLERAEGDAGPSWQ